ncbi:hypothetical protein B0293_12575 [Amycolatopsis azurea DSM 43854]|uniref:Uncharacterized protein n=1 Tax=Amycolatopsis azurea DSM 43854 TaxID=1238180 RepID=A0ABX3JF24_9PSEU|nr:hypothetical protein B0293_12575 [Amycolatopsis azurea DSM 43854]
MTFTCGVLPGDVPPGDGGVPHGFVIAAGAALPAFDDGAPLLGGGLLDGGWLLDGGLLEDDGGLLEDGGVLDGGVVGGRQTISNSTVAVPLAAGRFGPPSQWKLALYLPTLLAAFPCPMYGAWFPDPDWTSSVTGPVRPVDVTAVRVP